MSLDIQDDSKRFTYVYDEKGERSIRLKIKLFWWGGVQGEEALEHLQQAKSKPTNIACHAN